MSRLFRNIHDLYLNKDVFCSGLKQKYSGTSRVSVLGRTTSNQQFISPSINQDELLNPNV